MGLCMLINDLFYCITFITFISSYDDLMQKEVQAYEIHIGAMCVCFQSKFLPETEAKCMEIHTVA